MAANYSHTTRADGLTLTASIYNADHQNHIDNMVPGKIDDYSTNVTEMQSTADPGEVGTESLATSLGGELDRLRFLIKEITGKTQWYETPATDLATLATTVGRNLIINGDGRIKQRPTLTMTSSYAYGGPDRFKVKSTATTPGTYLRTSSSNLDTDWAHKFNDVSGSGVVGFLTRLEGKDMSHVTGQNVTITLQIYTTTAATFTIYVGKASAYDDFTTVTPIDNDGGTAVSGTTKTTITYALTGATLGDVTNGLEIKVESGTTSWSTSDIEWNIKLEKGSGSSGYSPAGVNTAQELEMCKRFAQNLFVGWRGYSPAASENMDVNLNVSMRGTPSCTAVTDSSEAAFGAGATGDLAVITEGSAEFQYGLTFRRITTGASNSARWRAYYFIESEL